MAETCAHPVVDVESGECFACGKRVAVLTANGQPIGKADGGREEQAAPSLMATAEAPQRTSQAPADIAKAPAWLVTLDRTMAIRTVRDPEAARVRASGEPTEAAESPSGLERAYAAPASASSHRSAELLSMLLRLAVADSGAGVLIDILRDGFVRVTVDGTGTVGLLAPSVEPPP